MKRHLMRSVYFKAMVLGLVLLGWAGSSFAQINLIDYTNVWKFEQSGSDLGTTWKNVGFVDSSWPSGPGVLGYPANEDVRNVAPIQTPLNRFKSDNVTQVITYYFRTHFTVTNTAQPVSIVASNVVDD